MCCIHVIETLDPFSVCKWQKRLMNVDQDIWSTNVSTAVGLAMKGICMRLNVAFSEVFSI